MYAIGSLILLTMILFSITLVLKYAHYHTTTNIERNLNGAQTVVLSKYNHNELQFIKNQYPKSNHLLTKLDLFIYNGNVYPISVEAMEQNFFSKDALKLCNLESCDNELKNGEAWIEKPVYNKLSIKINDKIYINGTTFIVKGFAEDNLTYDYGKMWRGSSVFITQHDAIKHLHTGDILFFFPFSKQKVLEENLFEEILDIYDQNSPNFYGYYLKTYLKYIQNLQFIIYLYLIIHFFSISFAITSFFKNHINILNYLGVNRAKVNASLFWHYLLYGIPSILIGHLIILSIYFVGLFYNAFLPIPLNIITNLFTKSLLINFSLFFVVNGVTIFLSNYSKLIILTTLIVSSIVLILMKQMNTKFVLIVITFLFIFFILNYILLYCLKRFKIKNRIFYSKLFYHHQTNFKQTIIFTLIISLSSSLYIADNAIHQSLDTINNENTHNIFILSAKKHQKKIYNTLRSFTKNIHHYSRYSFTVIRINQKPVKDPIEGEIMQISDLQKAVYPGHNKKQKTITKIDVNFARELSLSISDSLTIRINGKDVNVYVNEIIPYELFDIISAKPTSLYLSNLTLWDKLEKYNPISLQGDYQKIAKKISSIIDDGVILDLNYYSKKIALVWKRIFLTTNLLNIFLTAFFIFSLIYIQINKHPSRMHDLKIISILGASREQCKQYYTKEILWEIRAGFLFSFCLINYFIYHFLIHLKLTSTVSTPALILSAYLLIELLTRAFIKFFMNTTFDQSIPK